MDTEQVARAQEEAERRRVAVRGDEVIRGVAVTSDLNGPFTVQFCIDGVLPSVTLGTREWQIHWEDEWLASRRIVAAPPDTDHGADWSDWGFDHPEEGPSCKCGFNGSPEECAASRSQPVQVEVPESRLIAAAALREAASEFSNAAAAGVEPVLNRLAAKLLFARARRLYGPIDSEPVRAALTAVTTLAKHMANVASDWNHNDCGDDDARRALAALGGDES